VQTLEEFGFRGDSEEQFLPFNPCTLPFCFGRLPSEAKTIPVATPNPNEGLGISPPKPPGWDFPPAVK